MTFEEFIETVDKDIDENFIPDYLTSSLLRVCLEYSQFRRRERKEQALDSLGNVYYYLSVIAKVCDFQEVTLPPNSNDLLSYMGLMCQVVEDFLYNGIEIKKDYMDRVISNILNELEKDCRSLDMTPSEVMKENIERER